MNEALPFAAPCLFSLRLLGDSINIWNGIPFPRCIHLKGFQREEIMMRFGLIHLVVCFVVKIVTMQVGIIKDTSLSTSCAHPKMNASTCHTCLCEILYTTQNISVLSLNCYIISNNEVNCELFTKAIYLTSCSFHMENKSNSTYYFHQLPPNNQSITTATTMKDSLAGKSSQGEGKGA